MGIVNLAVLACLLRTTTKYKKPKQKGSQLFEEKSAPQTKSWLRLWLGVVTFGHVTKMAVTPFDQP